MLAPILFVARVEFDVTIAGSFVLEESQTKITTERHLVTVRLYVIPGEIKNIPQFLESIFIFHLCLFCLLLLTNYFRKIPKR